MTVLTKHGAPLPFGIESRGSPLVPHAVIRCGYCQEESAFVWRHPINPTLICQRFVRGGWEVYKSGKARCPSCKHRRAMQKAAFARINKMQMKSPISFVKTDKPPAAPAPSPSPPVRDRQVCLLIIDENGVPSLHPIDNAQEMLFGEQTYLVIPHDEVSR